MVNYKVSYGYRSNNSKKKKFWCLVILLLTLTLIFKSNIWIRLNPTQKDSAKATIMQNKELKNYLNFDDKEDFDFASRGLIEAIPNMKIKDKDGNVVWDMESYAFIKGESPETVNPSLWRQAKLNMNYGLFEVKKGIYQVRGYDLANISFVRTNNGWIVIDPLTNVETAKAALDIVNKNFGKRPIKAVIYTHSHVDHFGGIKGIVSEEDVKSGRVKIIAPKGFMEEAISENVMAGTAMSRRAIYQGGMPLEKCAKGQVDSGLGKTAGTGHVSLIAPTHTVSRTGTRMNIDGINIVFQYTPGAEAPSEMMFYFPQYRALCLAEECNATLHNIYTLRGAKIRDAKLWAKHLDDAVDLFGRNVEVSFASHHWPRWGNDRVIDQLENQRDLYKYIHDQTLHLANKGYVPEEIAEMIEIPEEIGKRWYNRGYYGTVNHGVKAVYQNYLGWFNGNPALLHKLPQEESAKRYVEFMGGEERVMRKAYKSYKEGDYRWVAEVMNHVVFANPDNMKARYLEADALEQLGYQAESAIWRNFYMMGAKELREGVKAGAAMKTASEDVITSMTLDMIFDYLAIRLNSEKAKGKDIGIDFNFNDTNQKYCVYVKNSVLNYKSRRSCKGTVNTSVIMTRAVFNDIQLQRITLEDAIKTKKIVVKGSENKFNEFLGLFDTFDMWFNIVTP